VDSGLADAETYNNLAWLSLFSGGPTDADVDLALRAVNLAGARSAAALHTLAAIYAEMGRVKEARGALGQVLASRRGGLCAKKQILTQRRQDAKTQEDTRE
jgi:Tetratricopeptide repeat